MHILTLTPFYPTAADDASGCFIAESVQELQRQGITSSVIAVKPRHRPVSSSAPNAPQATWKNYFSLPGNAGLSTAGRFLHAELKSQLTRLHAEQPIALIHAHAALPCGHAALLLARDLDIPFVVTVHGLDVFSSRQVSGWLGRHCAAVSKEVYRAAARVLCISQHVAQRVREGSKTAGNLQVVYNGVDTSMFQPLPAPAIPTASSILSVGNLIPIKGHELLLRAVAATSQKFPQVQCNIVGDGPERLRLQQLARELHIADRVFFLGRRSRLEVAQALRECTIFALPSWYEGLGCVYLEAMATERASIACRGQGIEEIIRHRENGWLIEPQNLSDLTSALHDLLVDNHLREALGRNGRQTVLYSHTLAHQANQLLSIYRECLS